MLANAPHGGKRGLCYLPSLPLHNKMGKSAKNIFMETNVDQKKYILEISSDEADLLYMLIESLATKEGLVAEHGPTAMPGEFRLHLGPAGGQPYLLIECNHAPDKAYNLMVQRLRDKPQAHQHLAIFSDFIVNWYTELRKAFFR